MMKNFFLFLWLGGALFAEDTYFINLKTKIYDSNILFDYNNVFELVNDNINDKEAKGEINRIYPYEPDCVNKELVCDYRQIARPIFLMGYKDNDVFLDGRDKVKKEICINILLEMIMGRSSKLYNKMYDLGLINGTFEYDYTIEENYAFSSFGGEADDPHKVREVILDAIKSYEVNEEDFNIIKKAHVGDFIKQFNSVERISNTFIEMYFKGIKSLDVYEILESVTIDDMSYYLKEHFKDNRFAMSIVYPTKS